MKTNKNILLEGQELSRRKVVKALAGAASFMIVPRQVLGGRGIVPPSDKVNLAGIGTGAKGFSDLLQMDQTGQVNIGAICEVDDRQMERPAKRWPQAPTYRDFRKMLEQQKDLDAVVVATPDHTHAVAAMAAIQLGKHIYCEKPFTHDIYEARKVAQAAQDAKVVTQLGNQGHSGEGIRLTCEWIWDGAIGEVERVEVWTNRGGSDRDRSKETPFIPAELDWVLWLGTAPFRPYHSAYHPERWRNWWDFGTGPLGDMASHLIDMPYLDTYTIIV